MTTNVEDTVQELQNLAAKKPLSRKKLAKAKELMRELKRRGYTNIEICELTNGAWSESSLKNYTRGVGVEDNREKNATIRLFAELIENGQTLDDVKNYLSISNLLEDQGWNLDRIPNLIERLKQIGVSPIDLETIIQTTEQYGGRPEVLNALETFGDLQSLTQEVADKQEESTKLQKQI